MNNGAKQTTRFRAFLIGMNWLKAAFLPVALCALFILSFLTFKLVAIHHVAHAQVLVSPFQLELEYRSFDPNPDGEVTSRRTDARRSDGVTALSETIMFPNGPRTTRRLTFLDGRIVTIDDLIASKTTMRRHSVEGLIAYKKSLTHPPENCVRPGETFAGWDTVLDQRVAKVSKSFQEGETVGEFVYWRAPALGCERLRYEEWAQQADGSLKLEGEARPVSLRLAEPDANLFDEGASYSELSPSERVHRKLVRLGIPDTDEGLRRWYERADKVYSENR